MCQVRVLHGKFQEELKIGTAQNFSEICSHPVTIKGREAMACAKTVQRFPEKRLN